VCERHVAVKLFTATCSFSDADSQFFQIQENLCSYSLLKVCTTAQQYIGTNVRLPREKYSMKFNGILSETSIK